MTGPDEPTTRGDFPGGFPGDERNAFSQAGRTRQEQELFDFIRKLAHLHTELDPLSRGAAGQSLPPQVSSMPTRRTVPRWAVVVVINNETKPDLGHV